MIAPTPEQLRSLADSLNEIERTLPNSAAAPVVRAVLGLYAAAAQIEAVWNYVEGNWSHGQLTTGGMYLPLVDVGPLLNMLTNGEQR